MLALALVFAGLIAYGSLYPFANWTPLAGSALQFLHAWPAHVQKADLVQNVLAYLPLGLFFGAWLMRRLGIGAALALATLIGGALSLTLEILQQYLPARVPSVVDLCLNILGSAGGAVLAALLRGHGTPGPHLRQLRAAWLEHGMRANLGLAALALWALSQTSPLVPTLDPGQIRAGLAQVLRGVLHPQYWMISPALQYACFLAALGLLARLLVAPGKDALRVFALLVLAVFALKVVVEGRRLSAEALAGALLAFAFLLAWGGQARRRWAWAGLALLAVGVVLSELTPGRMGGHYAFNWVPFAGQMRSLSGLQNILEVVWPFFAMACFARMLCRGGERALALGGGVAIAAAVFWLEWMQQHTPGRFGDVTQVMLAWTGWMMPWAFEESAARTPAQPAPAHQPTT